MNTENPDNHSTDSSPERNSNRRKLVGLFGIAIVPMMIAYAMFFYFPELIPVSTTNEGELIQPPLAASDLELVDATPVPAGVWTLLIPVAGHCDEGCVQRLYLSRQIVVGLGKDADRVQRVALHSAPADPMLTSLIAAEHPDLLSYDFAADSFNAALAKRFPAAVNDDQIILLMDPNGNIMMLYRAEKIGMPLRKDIRHLLKISNIG
jgi:cytochrome oxidase Cu insertion factor (SCO1/SenC/PrrC family)